MNPNERGLCVLASEPFSPHTFDSKILKDFAIINNPLMVGIRPADSASWAKRRHSLSHRCNNSISAIFLVAATVEREVAALSGWGGGAPASGTGPASPVAVTEKSRNHARDVRIFRLQIIVQLIYCAFMARLIIDSCGQFPTGAYSRMESSMQT